MSKPAVFEDILIDESNIEFKLALDFVNQTNRLIYLTGKAGTGKSTFIQFLSRTTKKKAVIIAPTGVSAIHAGGQTIHSFFSIDPKVYIPNDKRLRKVAEKNDVIKSTIYNHFKFSSERLQLLRSLELLIIDEVSMVRCDLLDVIDRILRVFRGKENEPFGGVQVVLVGDPFQLPPVAKPDEWKLLEPYYKSRFFFHSKVIQDNKPVYIEFKKIYRQNDLVFIELLNRLRVDKATKQDIDLLFSKYNPTFTSNDHKHFITISTHSKTVNSINLTKLAELAGEVKSFEALISGDFLEKDMPTDKLLHLKEGAQIIFIKNDSAKRYYNGKIGKISNLENNSIIVETQEGQQIVLDRYTWHKIKYTWNAELGIIEEEKIGSFTQYPIKLAWAITVHKSQGLTFENVYADLAGSFASGQVYVALSRCTSFEGIVLKSPIFQFSIISSPEVIEFSQNETSNSQIMQDLINGKADFFYKKARVNIEADNFSEAYTNLLEALRYRNDIENEAFKKYFIIKGKQLSNYKRKFQSIYEEIEPIKKQNKKLTANASKSTKSKVTTPSDTKKLKKDILLLKAKIKELEKLNHALKLMLKPKPASKF